MWNRVKPASWYFFVFLIALTISSGATKTLFYPPQSVHQWRQADCAAQFRNFYQNGGPVWKPQTYNYAGKNGYVASEFPILYWLAAQPCKVFGFQEAWLRGLDLLLFYIGLWCLFLLGRRLIGNDWLALLPPVLLGTSPYAFYYADNFLPNMPAISMCLIGWFYFFRYAGQKRLLDLYWAGAWMTLAALIKVSEGISLVALGALFVLEWLGLPYYEDGKHPRRHLLHKAAVLITGAALVTGWNLYAIHYNQVNGNGQNLLGFNPFWIMNRQAVIDTFSRMVYGWGPDFHHPLLMGLFLLAVPGIWWRWRQWKPVLTALSALTLAGVVIASAFWFNAYYHHDYYMLTLLIFPVFLYLMILEGWKRELDWSRPWVRNLVVGLLTVVTVLGLRHNHNRQHYRYNDPVFKYVNGALYTIEPYLRSIGIDRHDPVVSTPDGSPNITLYLMNNPGWTDAFTTEQYNINYFREAGAKYLIVHDSSAFQNPWYQPYLHDPIGTYQGVLIYNIAKQE